MPRSFAPPSPGYGRIVPIILGLVSVVCFVTCVPLLTRNVGFAPMDATLAARVVGYVEDMGATEGQLVQLRLEDNGRLRGLVTTRDDRPWRTFAEGEEVRLLVRMRWTRRGDSDPEYIVDDFAAKWGGLLARATLAVGCNIAAVLALVLWKRRPSAARHFPPPLPRSPVGPPTRL